MANGTTPGNTGGFNTNLLLASLLAGGGAMVQGDSPWPAVSNVAAQQMATQNYMNTLQKLLAGGGDPGQIPAGASLTMDRDSTVMKVPTSALGQGGFEGLGIGTPGSYISPPSTRNITAPPSAVGNLNVTPSAPDNRALMSAYLNPSASPLGAITAADLVGLTPRDLSQAVGLMQTRDRIELAKKAQKAKEEAEARDARLREEVAKTGRIKAHTDRMKLFREAPLTVPGLGAITLDEWNALDTKTKAYSYYVYDAKIRGEAILPYNEWSQQTDEPTAKQIYDIAKDDPDFEDFYFKSKKAGATKISIGEKVETAEALADVKARKYFTDPKGLVKDVDNYIDTEEVQNQLFQYASEPQQLEIEKVRLKESFITNKIKAAGGEIIDAKLDGRDFVWTVKWPDESTSEVRYAN